jgi:hypothetical protein
MPCANRSVAGYVVGSNTGLPVLLIMRAAALDARDVTLPAVLAVVPQTVLAAKARPPIARRRTHPRCCFAAPAL